MSDMPMVDKAKSFWEKPEGRTGMIFAAGGILGLFLIMVKWGATIVAAASNTFILGLYVLGALGIGYVLLDPKFRGMISYAYKGVMRWLTGMVIQIDPIAILKSYVEDLKESHEKMNKQITNLKGVISELQRKMRENENLAKANMSIAAEAKKKLGTAGDNLDYAQRMKAEMTLKTRKAGRLQESNKTFNQLYTKMEMIYRVLSKMYVNCGVLIEDTEDSIEQKEIEWKTIRIAHGAMRSAMSIINGDKDKRALYEQALDIMAADLGAKVGEMERFMEVSQSFLDGIDLQNGVFEEKGLQMLEKWEQDTDSWLLGDEKSTIIAAANDKNNILNVERPLVAEHSSSNQYGKLFQ
jgi:hypothetical protein